MMPEKVTPEMLRRKRYVRRGISKPVRKKMNEMVFWLDEGKREEREKIMKMIDKEIDNINEATIMEKPRKNLLTSKLKELKEKINFTSFVPRIKQSNEGNNQKEAHS